MTLPKTQTAYIVGWGWGRPLLIPLSLDAYGLSIWVPLALRFLSSTNTNSWLRERDYRPNTRYGSPIKKFWHRR